MVFRIEHKYLEPTLYTIVCLLYLLRRILFGAFSIPGRALFVLFFVWSAYYFVQVLLRSVHSPYIKMLNLLVGLILLYGVPLLLFGTDATWVRQTKSSFYLIIHLESILPIYSFYYFGRKGMIDDKWFKYIAVLFFFVAYILYERHRIQHMLELGQDEVTNNAAYLWLSLFPILALFKKKPLIQYLGVFIIMYYVLLGFKRGAILLGSICFLVMLWHTLRASKYRYKIVFILAVAVILYFFIPLIQDLLVNSNYFSSRVDKTLAGDASSREVNYPKYWYFFWGQTNFFAFIFGNGAFATDKLLGLMAHNDWLEFLINMGLFGAFIYLVYWIKAIKMCMRSARICRPEVYRGILFFVIIYLGRTLFSMSIMDMSFFATSVFGYLAAQYDNQNTQSLFS